MEDREKERQMSTVPLEEAKVQEIPAEYAVLLVFCHPHNVTNLVEALEQQVAQAAGAFPLTLLWSGHSSLLHMGAVLLEWEGTVTQAFLHQLSIDHEIFDYVVCELTTDENQEEQAETAQDERDKREGGQLV